MHTHRSRRCIWCFTPPFSSFFLLLILAQIAPNPLPPYPSALFRFPSYGSACFSSHFFPCPPYPIVDPCLCPTPLPCLPFST
jgi:hypothetical protein